MQPAPCQNHLLASLPLADYQCLLSALEGVPLPAGWTVHDAGEEDRYLYFLTAGIVSRIYATKDGTLTDFGVTGNEGVVGIASFLGGASTPSRAVVLCAGFSYRLPAHRLKTEFEHDGPLPRLLLRYTQALIAQTGQIAVCNRHHSLEQQVCRWMLTCLDRLPSNELAMTQETIGNMLGVRREGVTDAALKLQKAGLIQYTRGHIAVLDRPGLEARVCECYAAIKREYARLLSPQTTDRAAVAHRMRRPSPAHG